VLVVARRLAMPLKRQVFSPRFFYVLKLTAILGWLAIKNFL